MSPKDLICKYFVAVISNTQKLKRNLGLDLTREGGHGLISLTTKNRRFFINNMQQKKK